MSAATMTERQRHPADMYGHGRAAVIRAYRMTQPLPLLQRTARNVRGRHGGWLEAGDIHAHKMAVWDVGFYDRVMRTPEPTLCWYCSPTYPAKHSETCVFSPAYAAYVAWLRRRLALTAVEVSTDDA